LYSFNNLAFIVNPLPKIRLNTNGNEDAICDDNPKFSVELDAGIQDGTSITNYAYVWNKVGVSPSVGQITHWLYLKKVYTQLK
jgi:hypothetical protein